MEIDIETKKEALETKPLVISADMLVSGKIEKKDTEIDIEENINLLPKLTMILIAINVLIFIWESVTGVLVSKEEIIKAGALYRPKVLEGEYSRLISVMFLHGSIDHLLGNMIMLYLMGLIFENFFTTGRSISIYLLSGIGGALLSICMAEGPAVGASGAIYGLMGANGIFILKNRQLLTPINRRIGMVLIIASLYTIGRGFMVPFVDNFGHIGGFISGIILAYIIKGQNVIYMKYTKS